jgi:hypothetical protein
MGTMGQTIAFATEQNIGAAGAIDVCDNAGNP